MNLFYKYGFFLLFFLILLLGVGLIKIYNKSQNAEKQLVELMNDADILKAQINFLQEKSDADDLFIASDFDAALDKYSKLHLRSASDSVALYDQRLELVQKIKHSKEQGILKVEKKETEDSLLTIEKNIARQIIALEGQKYNTIIDSLHISASILSERMSELQKDLSDALQKRELTFTNPKGNKVVYLGIVKNQMANGVGTGVWSTGSIYQGEWKDNQRHGQGVFEWADGEKYEGGYKNDKRNGYGKYFWKNGEVYEGEWKDDMRNGKGSVYHKSGKLKLKGNWKNDEFIKNGNGET